ncbi:spore coat protein [Ectobacillus ponti]|uniref:Spore coat protein n=1 Tax=Ectobacillus ponti TaxID=2961894 RepID=A0AA41X1Q9_9BACI|nr:spore coat protein [Ectobacillus ponti]MCP8967364.1 spore coat protein [Ectobacillus ponti]
MQQQVHNLHAGTLPMNMNHGGHETIDVSELLTDSITLIDQMLMQREYIQDPELREIVDRQYQFALQEYDGLVTAFTMNQAPQPMRYQSSLPVQVQYGMQQMPTRKPLQTVNDITDQHISAHLLVGLKASAVEKSRICLEITNPVMRHAVANSIPNCIEMAYEMFLWQNKNGYYPVPQFAQQDMQMMMNSYAPSSGKPAMGGMNRMQ